MAPVAALCRACHVLIVHTSERDPIGMPRDCCVAQWGRAIREGAARGCPVCTLFAGALAIPFWKTELGVQLFVNQDKLQTYNSFRPGDQYPNSIRLYLSKSYPELSFFHGNKPKSTCVNSGKPKRNISNCPVVNDELNSSDP